MSPSPGEASRSWMRGWHAGIRAAWILLVERGRTGLHDANAVDQQAEREGLLVPEPRTREVEDLRKEIAVLRAENGALQARERQRKPLRVLVLKVKEQEPRGFWPRSVFDQMLDELELTPEDCGY